MLLLLSFAGSLRHSVAFLVSFYCFVTKALARMPGAAASVECRRRERRTLLAGTAGELAGRHACGKLGLRAHAHSLCAGKVVCARFAAAVNNFWHTPVLCHPFSVATPVSVRVLIPAAW